MLTSVDLGLVQTYSYDVIWIGHFLHKIVANRFFATLKWLKIELNPDITYIL